MTQNKYSTIADRIISSRQPLMKFLLVLLVIGMTITSLLQIKITIQSLFSPYVYMKDFTQEYTMAYAARSGLDIYAPLSELVKVSIGQVPVAILPTPSPHPPIVALAFIPLSFFSYPIASMIWYVIELCFIVLSAALILRCLNQKVTFTRTLLLVLLFLAWHPFRQELVYGQLMISILVILCAVWVNLKSNNPVWAGFWLGLSVSIKLITLPMIIWLFVTRRWRAALSALGTFIFLNLITIATLGFQTVWKYYTTIGKQVYLSYVQHSANYSGWTLAWRIFAGTTSSIMESVISPPLISLPSLAGILAPVAPLILFLVAMILIFHIRNIDIEFSLMICACIFMSPIVWVHYFVLLAIPLAHLAYHLLTTPNTKWLSGILLTVGLVIFYVSDKKLMTMIAKLARIDVEFISKSILPFHIGILSYLPGVALLLVFGIIYHLGLTTAKTFPITEQQNSK